MKERLRGMENCQHHQEGQEVKDRTDRSDEDHEITDELDVPALRFLYVARIYVISRYRHLGKVVEKVIQQDLRRQHGQERQEYKGASHTEHIPEVRTGSHQQVLHHIAECLTTLNDALMEHVQLLLK